MVARQLQSQMPEQGQIPVEVYDNLYRQFNPTNFDAKEWARLAKAAGIKYMVLTAKHCDGFLLWHPRPAITTSCTRPSSATSAPSLPGRPTSGPAHRLVFLADGLARPGFPHRAQRGFVARMQGEIRELLSNYGPIDVPVVRLGGGKPMYDQPSTYSLVKKLQPKIILDQPA